MSYTLVIVESPAKCKKIEKYLGPGYKCIASFGHISELNGLKSIDIQNNFTPNFSSIETKRQQIGKMRKLISTAQDVMLAADDDREGEAIAWHICREFNLPVETTKRIIFHEITETALKKAVKEPTILNMNIVHAQQARQILDLLVGYKISPILWEKITYKKKEGLSAGRCQTPALRLVYENQKDIDDSPGTKVYNTIGYFTKENLPFNLDYHYDEEVKIVEFLEESVNHDHMYNCGKLRNTTKNSPKPFTTSGLQQTASNVLKLSPKDTMATCQKLYEGGYITYMRTDSTTYSKEFIDTTKLFIEETYGIDYINENINDLSERKEEKKVKKSKSKKKEDVPASQEAHEAIRPTDIGCIDIDDEMTNREKKLYKLIRENTLESCMSPATYKALTAVISAHSEHNYKYSTEQVIFPGWKIVGGYERENPLFAYLQTIKNDSVIEYKKITSKVTLKNLKSHYTEAKLVQLLEQQGIGRPSTFSSLIDKIQTRQYVKKTDVKGKKIACTDFELEDVELSETTTEREFGNERAKLVIQPLGLLVIEFLIDNFNTLFHYEYTKSMEDTLDKIAKGDYIWHELCGQCLHEIDDLSKEMGYVEKEKIKIDEHHTWFIGKFGPCIKCTIDGTTTFKPAKDNIDLTKLRSGEYKVEDIVGTKKTSGKNLGKYKEKEVILKNGRFGLYVEFDGKNVSVKIDKSLEDINLEDIIDILCTTNHPSMVRTIDEDTSIRTGKYGNYVFHKKSDWKKPRFLKLDGFVKINGVDSYKTCDIKVLSDWLKETYKI
jgi:DNA topoisomerase-1